MDALGEAATLESMSICDDNQLRTADGEGGVDLTDANTPKASTGTPTVDKENEGAQRAGAEHRSLVVGDILFGAQASNQYGPHA